MAKPDQAGAIYRAAVRRPGEDAAAALGRHCMKAKGDDRAIPQPAAA